MNVAEMQQCDAPGCKELHSRTNGWWLLIKDRENGIHLYPVAIAEQKNLLPFGNVYCGHAHLLPALSAMLGEKSQKSE